MRSERVSELALTDQHPCRQRRQLFTIYTLQWARLLMRSVVPPSNLPQSSEPISSANVTIALFG